MLAHDSKNITMCISDADTEKLTLLFLNFSFSFE